MNVTHPWKSVRSVCRFAAIFLFIGGTSAWSFAQAPRVFKVEPPSWWFGHSINPVRLLIKGSSFQGATIQAISPGLRTHRPRINSAGTYILLDVTLTPQARPGSKTLRITTSSGSTNAHFDLLESASRAGRFEGFSTEDVLYLIMIDRFSDGDLSNNDLPQSNGLYDRKNKFYYHGGDLQGVINRLPYLKELGVTALWLTPWYDNYDHLNEIELKEGKPCTGFHGYNPQDFYAVEEHFGTLAKLRELVDVAHKQGIKVIQDAVVNHTGPYHPWVDDPPTPTWFNGTRQKHVANPFQTWVLHDPRPVGLLKQATMEGWFLDFLPDLNQNDTDVERYLIQNTLWWIGITGIDGIRMDTWQYVPNTFWHQWTRAIKREYPRFTVVGEVKDGDVVHTSYFQGGRVRDGADPGLDSLLDFPVFFAVRHAFAEGKDLEEIPKTLAKDYLYTDSSVLVTLLGGHDDGRFMSEKGATMAGLKLANAFVLTTRGIPQLYYGDEIGMTGPDEPATRADFPGGFPGDSRNAFTKEGRTSEEQDLFDYVRRAVHLHTELEPLRRGELVNLHIAAQQYAYARKSRTGAVVVVINNANSGSTMSFDVAAAGLRDGARLVDRLGHYGSFQVEKGKLKMTLQGRTAVVLAPP